MTPSSSTYIDSLNRFGSVSFITIPTRITDTPLTIIDYTLTNDTSNAIKPGVIRYNNNLSDHYVFFVAYLAVCHKKRMYKFNYICSDKAMKRKYKIFSNKLSKIKATAKKLHYENEFKNMRVT